MAFKEEKLNMSPKEIVMSRHHFEAISESLKEDNPENQNELHRLFDYETDYATNEVELDRTEYFMQRLMNYEAKYGDKARLVALEARDINGRSPMQVAMLNGHKQAALKLITYGCDVNNKDNEGSTILHLAAASDIPMTVQEIIYKGGDVNAKTNDGFTPAHIALYAKNRKSAEILANYGANLDEWERKSEREYFLAAELGVVKIYDAVSRGIDINFQDRNGDTALHYACRENNIELAQHLMEKGAALDIKNAKGYAPYQVGENATSDNVRIEGLKRQLDAALKAKQERNASKEVVLNKSKSM